MARTKDSNSLRRPLSPHRPPSPTSLPLRPLLRLSRPSTASMAYTPSRVSSLARALRPGSSRAAPRHTLLQRSSVLLGNSGSPRSAPDMISYLDSMVRVWTPSASATLATLAILTTLPLPPFLPPSRHPHPRAGVNVAVHCKRSRTVNGIVGVHVGLRESGVFRSAKLFKPLPTSAPSPPSASSNPSPLPSVSPSLLRLGLPSDRRHRGQLRLRSSVPRQALLRHSPPRHHPR
jgi:hypothetical protein